jgi:hypothetical protein
LGTSAYQTAFSASAQMPSGTPSPSSAQTLRLDRLPSASISNAVSRLAYDSATISVWPSGMMSMPLGNHSPSATCRAEPSGLIMATIPGAKSWPAMRSKPPPLR